MSNRIYSRRSPDRHSADFRSRRLLRDNWVDSNPGVFVAAVGICLIVAIVAIIGGHWQ